jgi:hypothetical protein
LRFGVWETCIGARGTAVVADADRNGHIYGGEEEEEENPGEEEQQETMRLGCWCFVLIQKYSWLHLEGLYLPQHIKSKRDS